jgi:chitodextrinase
MMNSNYGHASRVAALIGMLAGIPGLAAASTACPAPATGAFMGCYYNNRTLSGDPVFVRTDNQIDFYWGNGSPDASLQPLNFSVRWQGNFVFSQGNYTFSAITSDGLRLYIDGNLILDRWRDQPPYFYTATQTISQGSHLVTVEYYEHLGGATAQVLWQNNSPVNSQAPVISSFTSTPASTAPGSPVTLAWNVSGATSVTIDNGVGDVTDRSSITASPVSTTTYTLKASNTSASSVATVTVTVTASPAGDTQPPSAPTLVSATAASSTQVNLIWTASTDNVGVTGYQITRNGTVIGSVSGSMLAWADTSVSPSTTYMYAVKAYDGAGNFSVAGNSVQVTTPANAPPPGACPAPATNAFTGCYYNNTTLSGDPVFVRTDGQLNFDWGNHSPDAALQPLNFSARWQGNFMFSQGDYSFSVITSDGMRLYVDGNLILNAWRDQSPNSYTVTQTISQGSHLIVVEYYERLGGATAQVSWRSTSGGTQAPVISSFTSTPTTTAPGLPVTLAWSISGATSVSIDNGVGDVTTRSSITASPAQTTTYTLTATGNSGSASAAVQVTVSSGADTQPPTVPTLLSATAASAAEVDLAWSASTDNVAVAGYQIYRNGSAISSVPGTVLTYADTTASPATTYIYTVTAYDAAGNHSALSNELQATTQSGPPISVTWYGGCWYEGTVGGVTGRFQAVDFAMTTATPVAVQGTLFFGSTCDTSLGTDNMNDFNTLTGSTHMIRGFSYHHDEMPTSAVYWMGDRTSDGQCPKGAPCSGCIHYTPTTPTCDKLP